MKALSLFSGIGGLDSAAEKAGIEVIAFCEIDPFCTKVLNKRWTNIPVIDDVRKIKGEDFGTVDIVFGGFPCQDLSVAGKQEGLTGSRSGLWFEMLRVIKEIRPRFVVAENVRGAVNLALDTVCDGMAGGGYEVWPFVVPASAFGAPHKRERLFVIGVRKDVADAYSQRLQRGYEPSFGGGTWTQSSLEQFAGRGQGDKCLTPKLWATPNTMDHLAQRSDEALLKMASTTRAGRRQPPNLREQVDPTAMKVWETKQSIEREKAPQGQLNPDWVEILMGFPIGWTNLEMDEIEPWPGWPAPMVKGEWKTPIADDVISRTLSRNNRGELKLSGQAQVDGADVRLWATPTASDCQGSKCGQGRNIRNDIYDIKHGIPVAEQYDYEPMRTVKGGKDRAARIKALGNAVVPQQAYPFFRAVVEMG